MVIRHIYSEAMEKANEMNLSHYYRKTYRRRSETVERSFADAKQYHGYPWLSESSDAMLVGRCCSKYQEDSSGDELSSKNGKSLR